MESGETLVSQRGGGCTISGSIHGQVGCEGPAPREHHPSIPPAITLMLPLRWRSSAPRAHRHCGQDRKGAHLSGVRLFPFSFTSRSSSEESTGEVVLASRSSCSCWARYWAGFCLASLAQCSSSRCSRGRLACKRAARVKRAACKQFQQR